MEAIPEHTIIKALVIAHERSGSYATAINILPRTEKCLTDLSFMAFLRFELLSVATGVTCGMARLEADPTDDCYVGGNLLHVTDSAFRLISIERG